jgi:hypothetical protein
VTEVYIVAAIHPGQKVSAYIRREVIDGQVEGSSFLLPPSEVLPAIAARDTPMTPDGQVHTAPALEEIFGNLTAGAARSDHEHVPRRKLAGVGIAARCNLKDSERQRCAEYRHGR